MANCPLSSPLLPYASAAAAAASFEPPTPPPQLISKSLLPLSSNLDAPQRWSLRPRSLSGRWIHPHFLHAEVDLSSCDACPSSSSSFLALFTHSAILASSIPSPPWWVIAENDASLRPLRRQFGAKSFQLRRAAVTTAAVEPKPNQNILRPPDQPVGNRNSLIPGRSLFSIDLTHFLLLVGL